MGPDATPTVSTSNCDLRNLKILHCHEIPELYLLNTVLIDYKGISNSIKFLKILKKNYI